MTATKNCEACGAIFLRNYKYSQKQWDKALYCHRGCSSWRMKEQPPAEKREMQWKLVAEFPDYEISEYGDSRNIATGRMVWRSVRNGYSSYYLGQGGPQLAHRLVAKAFIGSPPPDQPEVRHLDGTRNNNHYTNLRWGSHPENMADTIAHGTNTPGEKNKASKLKDAEVREIRQLVARGFNHSELGRMFGVRSFTIGNIACGKTWKHLT